MELNKEEYVDIMHNSVILVIVIVQEI